ncbi:response regulator [Inquilinus sp. KBS0705]|nr:response regulator [Inquilinus sp. KBS0705]
MVHQPISAFIIDDDKIFVYGFNKLLQLRHLDAQIQAFNNGKEAIDFLTNPINSQFLPDIIFLDINMPVMNGWEFLKEFEEIQSQLGKKISIYAITSSVDVNDIERAKNNTLIKDYILKPINDTHLKQIFNLHGDEYVSKAQLS